MIMHRRRGLKVPRVIIILEGHPRSSSRWERGVQSQARAGLPIEDSVGLPGQQGTLISPALMKPGPKHLRTTPISSGHALSQDRSPYSHTKVPGLIGTCNWRLRASTPAGRPSCLSEGCAWWKGRGLAQRGEGWVMRQTLPCLPLSLAESARSRKQRHQPHCLCLSPDFPHPHLRLPPIPQRSL